MHKYKYKCKYTNMTVCISLCGWFFFLLLYLNYGQVYIFFLMVNSILTSFPNTHKLSSLLRYWYKYSVLTNNSYAETSPFTPHSM